MEEIAFKIDINVNIRDYVRIWEVRSAEEPPVVCVKIAFGADGALFVHVRVRVRVLLWYASNAFPPNF